MSDDKRHVPVLMNAMLAALDLRGSEVVVDCTLGLGGHSSEILRRIATPPRGATSISKGTATPASANQAGRLIGIDFDPANMEIARARLSDIRLPVAATIEDRGPGATFQLFHNNFAALPTVLAEAGVAMGSVDAVLADVGVASTQIDDPARGFSYRRPGPLDMRMDPTRGRPASDLVNKMSARELAAALLEYGDETDAQAIAELIVRRRAKSPILRTEQLMALVCEARDFTLERAAGAKLHPAARTFQALRILVNRELANLDRLLAVLPDVLKPGGVAAIISFHSGEDRRVKDAFKAGQRGGVYSEISREPEVATEEEARANPRARSAKLRWARRST